MKRTFTKQLLVITILLFVDMAKSQAQSVVIYDLTISDASKITSVTSSGGSLHVTFTNSSLTAVANSYTISVFKQLYPTSRFPHLRNIWRVKASNTLALINGLQSIDTWLFPDKRPAFDAVSCFIPSDWHRWSDDGYLGYINADKAWNYTHGDTSVIVGVVEAPDAGGVDTANPDLFRKFKRIDNPTGAGNHATHVTGLIAGRTNNDTVSYPAIGFDCRMLFVHNIPGSSSDDMHDLSLVDHLKVLNASWTDPGGYQVSTEDAYNEIYEEGTFTVAAAGDGLEKGDSAWFKLYPASYDNVFSVSGVGWKYTWGDISHKDWHAHVQSDTLWHCYQHNDAVDLLAPACEVGGLRPGAPWYVGGYAMDGTSFSAPLVSGTAALMLSDRSCLTPYQLEYWLKKCADSTPTNFTLTPQNAYWAGKLGSGGLDAGKVLDSLHRHLNHPDPNYNPCNELKTATLYIKGVEINSVCVPGYSSNSVQPTLNPIIENGYGNLTYRWEPLGNNTCTLDNYTSPIPHIISSTYIPGLGHMAQFRLTVKDQSEVPKVAKRFFYIRLRTDQEYDLAMRDSYMDMLTEPDSAEVYNSRDWHIWASPDLWARQIADNGTEPQNPEYTTAHPNEVYVRVRNVGCVPYTEGGTRFHVDSLQLYWTMASTGEIWARDWDGSSLISGTSGYVPTGGLIGAALGIPTLDPGQSVILSRPWTAPRPQDYYNSANADVCLLARITSRPISNPALEVDMAIPEIVGGNTSRNVRNNNNIVTRNLVVTNATGRRFSALHGLFLANTSPVSGEYDVQIIPERFINKHFSGDFSAVGYAVLRSPGLYSSWMASGGMGHGFTANDTDSSFTWAGSDELLLQSIPFDSGQKFMATLQFFLRDSISPMPFTYDIHVRQFEAGTSRDSAAIGDITYQLSVGQETDSTDQQQGQRAMQAVTGPAYTIYPNPATDQIFVQRGADAADKQATVRLLDMSGRLLRSKLMAGGDRLVSVDVKGVPRGEYLIQVNSADGKIQGYKVVLK